MNLEPELLDPPIVRDGSEDPVFNVLCSLI